MLRATIYTEEMLFSFYDQKLKKKKSETIIEYRQSLHFKLLLPRVIKFVHPLERELSC